MEYADIIAQGSSIFIDQSLIDLKLDYEQLLNRCQKIAVNYYRNNLNEMIADLNLEDEPNFLSVTKEWLNIDEYYSQYRYSKWCTLEELDCLAYCSDNNLINKNHPDLPEKFRNLFERDDDVLINKLNNHPATKIDFFCDVRNFYYDVYNEYAHQYDEESDDFFDNSVDIALGLSVPVSAVREVFFDFLKDFKQFETIKGICYLNEKIEKKICKTLSNIVIDELNNRYKINIEDMMYNTHCPSHMSNGNKLPFWTEQHAKLTDDTRNNNRFIPTAFLNSDDEIWLWNKYAFFIEKKFNMNKKVLKNIDYSSFVHFLTIAKLVQLDYSTDQNLIFAPPNLL